MNYKKQYLKYKTKYLLTKNIGGNVNNIKDSSKLDTKEKIPEKKNKIDIIYDTTLTKLDILKNKYQSMFDKGLKKKDVLDLLKNIHNIGKENQKKYKYSIQQQFISLNRKYKDLLENKNKNKKNTNEIKNIILDNLVEYYINDKNTNKIESLYNYLKKNSDIKLNNKKIEKYKKGNLLGEGFFGKVYQLPNNRVLKVINASKYKLPSNTVVSYEIDSIVDEINIMKKIKNKNIGPKIFDYWMGKDNKVLNIYIEMENKGITLTKWLLDNKLNETHIKKIKNKIKKLHEMGITHQDLHEDNILVQKNKNSTDFFISDFGLSKNKKDLFDNLKKYDYDLFKQFNNNYYLKVFLTLLLNILEIKLIQ